MRRGTTYRVRQEQQRGRLVIWLGCIWVLEGKPHKRGRSYGMQVTRYGREVGGEGRGNKNGRRVIGDGQSAATSRNVEVTRVAGNTHTNIHI